MLTGNATKCVEKNDRASIHKPSVHSGPIGDRNTITRRDLFWGFCAGLRALVVPRYGGTVSCQGIVSGCASVDPYFGRAWQRLVEFI